MSMFRGHDIRVKRQSLGLSAEALAEKLKVNKNNLYKWEKGHKPHDPEDFMKIKDWLAGNVESVPQKEESSIKDKLTTTTKAPAFAMSPNGNSDNKDTTIRNQSESVKTLADTTKAQQETISKLTDLVTKLVKQ